MWNDEEEDENVNLENGHYASEPEAADEESGDESNDDDEDNAGNFDTNLPTTHKYLGHLDYISGYTLYDDGEVIELFSICTNTLAFPGATLPLVLRADHANDIRNGYTFVLTCLNKEGTDLFTYGVIMEVFEHMTTDDSITLKARGRQRCRLLLVQRPRRLLSHQHTGRIKVEVLAEPTLRSPLAETQLLALQHRRPFIGDFDTYDQLLRWRRVHVAQFAWPLWVYDRNEQEYYARRIIGRLVANYHRETMPREPTALSYWFAQNFQLTYEERLTILACGTTLERLRNELAFLNFERLLCCGHCELDISAQNSVFPMSKDGVQSNYVNPGGVVYETVTVGGAWNYRLDGAPSKQFSWFPGYAWTIMKCMSCKSHLGWKFTAHQLNPPLFFGLARNCLKIKILSEQQRQV